MIDLHTHVLPGIDDGPRSIEGSLALAHAAVAAGTTVLVATPHVNEVYDNDAATIAGLVAELNAALAVEGIALEIRAGAEVAATRIDGLTADALQALSLGGGPWLLLECPLTPAQTGFEAIALYLKRQGHEVVLAHPERSPLFQRDPRALASLVAAGMLTSVTAGSLVGQFGRTAQAFAEHMAAQALIHNVASDAHDNVRRPPGLRAEIERAGLGPLREWLTVGVPGAILSGAEIPPRPNGASGGGAAAPPNSPASQRRWWRLGR